MLNKNLKIYLFTRPGTGHWSDSSSNNIINPRTELINSCVHSIETGPSTPFSKRSDTGNVPATAVAPLTDKWPSRIT